MCRLAGSFLTLGIVGHSLIGVVSAQEQESFFKGKTIDIAVGYAAGGGYDYYARLYSRHMGRHILGNPSIVVRNMPGAGSLRAANYLFNVAPKDGTALGVLTQTLMIEEAFGTQGVKYVSKDFNYIGRMSRVVEVTAVWHKAKAANVEDARKWEVIAGGNGPTDTTEGIPRLLNHFAGTKFKVISGFKGVPDILLAMERGEVDSVSGNWMTIERGLGGRVNLLTQISLKRNSKFPSVPTIVELARTPEDRIAIEFYTSSAEISRPLIAPPEVPQDRVRELRRAFDSVAKDPQLIAEVEKAGLDFDPASGEYLQDLVKKVAETPQSIVQRAREALVP